MVFQESLRCSASSPRTHKTFDNLPGGCNTNQLCSKYIYIYTDFYIICIGAFGLLKEIDTIDCKFWGGVLAFVQSSDHDVAVLCQCWAKP